MVLFYPQCLIERSKYFLIQKNITNHNIWITDNVYCLLFITSCSIGQSVIGILQVILILSETRLNNSKNIDRIVMIQCGGWNDRVKAEWTELLVPALKHLLHLFTAKEDVYFSDYVVQSPVDIRANSLLFLLVSIVGCLVGRAEGVHCAAWNPAGCNFLSIQHASVERVDKDKTIASLMLLAPERHC